MRTFFIVAALVLLSAAQEPQEVSCAVGEVINFTVGSDAPSDDVPPTMEWIQMEHELGQKSETWKYKGDKEEIADDGSATFTFTLECLAATTEVEPVNFVWGDVTLLDDALTEYEANPDNGFPSPIMDGRKYVTVALTVTE